MFHGPLRRNPANPRYFTDDSGRTIYMTGSHTWANLVDTKAEGDPDFPYDDWLNMLSSHNHNFMRLWTWDHPETAPWTRDEVTFAPMPHLRTGPDLALDGKPRWDLSQFNPAYFERLRQRVELAGARDIYVSVMFFEAWCVKWSNPECDAWLSHPYHASNNINGVNGDPDGDGRADVYTLDSPDVVRYQKLYVQQVIRTLNDLDNVLWEIVNEIPVGPRGVRWHYHMIDWVHDHELTLNKQHPVGMTAEGGGEDNTLLFASPADWVSPGQGPHREFQFDPPDAGGRKVVLTDTDHLWGHGGTYRWAWRSFLRGLNPIFMDPWWPIPGRIDRASYARPVLNTRDYPEWEPLRVALGQTRRFAQRLDLNRMTPQPHLASSRYCLADPGRTYLVYMPEDLRVSVDLSAAQVELPAEWLNTRTGETVKDGTVQGGALRWFTSPFGIDSVLLIGGA